MAEQRFIDPLCRDTGFMIVAAFRYCIGRHSYAPSLCCDWLRGHWRLLAEQDRRTIHREIGMHLDDLHRQGDPGTIPGWDIDRQTWERMAEWIGAFREPDLNREEADRHG
ncbi:hypothetical protein [Methylorubrum populi]|uniref:Uncharacterized protein n=1 Tax=Methylorubrum populi TaxID=223967 RepID=A0A833J406_9HYPH|nr:hypothetical protein [Methylorubrum populi]KAB7784057.1 hypothetical protein F8B43_3980 [Methylorubrum populi]